MRDILWVALVGVLGGVAAAALYARWAGTRAVVHSQRAVFEALRTANLTAPALRSGLAAEPMGRAVGLLRSLVGTKALVVADSSGILAAEGVDIEHLEMLGGHVEKVLAIGRPALLAAHHLHCTAEDSCPLSAGVIAPLQVDGTAVGALVALDSSSSTDLLRVCSEVARFVCGQLELAELDRSREREAQAELRFLRAQISPHFIYNALGAIESFVRSDPERARDLLVSFAELTRYAFASHAEFTTLAEELRLVDIYLELERARFGDRIDVCMKVAPEVLDFRLPSLVLQPVVENAVRHGLEPAGHGRLVIDIVGSGSEACIAVEDDGRGADPARLRLALAGLTTSVGLRNVDERLRTMFGEGHGLVVQSAPGGGTRVSFRVPKLLTPLPTAGLV